MQLNKTSYFEYNYLYTLKLILGNCHLNDFDFEYQGAKKFNLNRLVAALIDHVCQTHLSGTIYLGKDINVTDEIKNT